MGDINLGMKDFRSSDLFEEHLDYTLRFLQACAERLQSLSQDPALLMLAKQTLSMIEQYRADKAKDEKS